MTKTDRARIVEQVRLLYAWVDDQVARHGLFGCLACGRCCEFEAYGHRLYVSSPEMVYFQSNVPTKPRMDTGVCPFRLGARCTVYAHRFSACRVFCCRTDPIAQAELMEQVMRRLKDLCDGSGPAYEYVTLDAALNGCLDDTCLRAEAPGPEGESNPRT